MENKNTRRMLRNPLSHNHPHRVIILLLGMRATRKDERNDERETGAH
jgi:hypothetical protein